MFIMLTRQIFSENFRLCYVTDNFKRRKMSSSDFSERATDINYLH